MIHVSCNMTHQIIIIGELADWLLMASHLAPGHLQPSWWRNPGRISDPAMRGTNRPDFSDLSITHYECISRTMSGSCTEPSIDNFAWYLPTVLVASMRQLLCTKHNQNRWPWIPLTLILSLMELFFTHSSLMTPYDDKNRRKKLA